MLAKDFTFSTQVHRSTRESRRERPTACSTSEVHGSDCVWYSISISLFYCFATLLSLTLRDIGRE